MRVNVYIQPKTDTALSKLGGANRAENLRRAVALAEVAGELAKTLAAFQQGSGLWLPVEVSPEHEGEAQALYKLKGMLIDALSAYKEAKQ